MGKWLTGILYLLTGILYLLTGGFFLIGIIYDLWTLNDQISLLNGLRKRRS